MDLTAFTPNSLGRVCKTLEGYHAYFPEPVPRTVTYSNQTVQRLTDATAALHRLAGVSRLLPTPELLMGPYIRLEAVLSSKIEGTQTNVGDLLEAELSEAPVEGDAREVLNYARAMQIALTRLSELPLSLRLIRETHATLMDGVRGASQTPGEFRTTQNWIGLPGSTLSTATFVPPPPSELSVLLADLERFLHERELPTLIALALAHYQFETIHPFVDGNGRIGRLLVPLVLCERQILDRPLLYLSAFFERRRAQYYSLLFSTSATGDVTPWIDFFLEGVATQARDAEERTVRLVDLQQELREELLADRCSVTVVRLAEQLLDSPYLDSRSVQRTLGVTAPTANKAIGALVRRGILVEMTGQRRNRRYLSHRVFEAAYGDDLSSS